MFVSRLKIGPFSRLCFFMLASVPEAVALPSAPPSPESRYDCHDVMFSVTAVLRIAQQVK